MRSDKILKNVSAGLKQRVTIQQRSSTADGAGGMTFQWSDIATVWAAVENISIKERLLQERVSQQATHRFYIRFRSDVSHDDRIKYGGDTFSILTINNVKQLGVVLEIIARVEN